MKTLKYLALIALVPVYIAAAGDTAPADAETWMKQAIARECQRAEDARQQHADTERLEQKYGGAKEKHPDLYAAMMSANQKAADAWSAVARQGESATHPETMSEAKQAAAAATADAHLAELTINLTAAASERSQMAEKAGSAEVRALAAQLDANEKAQLAANRARNEISATAEKLQNENRALKKAFYDAYKQARSAGKPVTKMPPEKSGSEQNKQE